MSDLEDGNVEVDLSTKSDGKDQERKQTVLSLFGVQLTAPAELKYPFAILLGFVGINTILLLLLRKFVLLN